MKLIVFEYFFLNKKKIRLIKMDKIEDFHPLILNAPKQKYLFNLLI